MAKALTALDYDLITAQALREILWARRYKQGKIKNWQSNEQMYYAMKIPMADARANVELGRMQEFVHTLLSKIRRPLVFKYTKRKNSQLKRVKLLNAVKDADRKNNDWDMKDLVGKKQMVVYGRMMYSYFADSVDGIYKPHLDNVDTYDFLIDPAAGGIDVEKANYLGDYGVVFYRDELEAGMKRGDFIKDSTQSILTGVGNNTEVTQEETNKLTRMYGQHTIGKKELQSDDKFKFWRWGTTYKGVRYYMLLQERAGRAIRIDPLTDLVSATDLFPKAPWWYWTAAAFPDLTEFWTPSYCDYVREIFMAQNVSIDQMLDNAEAINKPMRKVNVNMIENLAELKYRKDGIIKVKGDFDVNQAYQTITVPSIDTPLKVFEALEGIQEKASGVTANSKGAADPEGKVAIYEGNKAEVADRFGLLDISYSFGYDRFARLHELGVRDNLSKKIAVDLIGPDGIEQVMVSRRDLFKNGDKLDVTVESSSDEMMETAAEKNVKFTFIQKWVDAQNVAKNANPNAPLIINPSKAFEMQGRIVGLKTEQIKELLDVKDFAGEDVLSEADRDIESILAGEDIKPNAVANSAYVRRFVDYLQDHEEDINDKTFERFKNYIDLVLGEKVGKNTAREILQHYIQTLETLPPGTTLPAALDIKSITSGAGGQPNGAIGAPMKQLAPKTPNAPGPVTPATLPQQPVPPPQNLPMALPKQ